MTLPVAALSSVLNNTPIVAALTPAVTEWARRRQLPASKFLIPLSYATILGGTITVIGTSTNLVVVGLIEKNMATSPGLRHLGIFDIVGVGLPTALIGCLAIVALGPILLPDRRPAVSKDDDPRVYSTELMLQAGSPLAGRSIEEAGLRNLPGAFLAELRRTLGLEGDAVATEAAARADAIAEAAYRPSGASVAAAAAAATAAVVATSAATAPAGGKAAAMSTNAEKNTS
jgi:di/tricarboxylate transporter